MSTAPRLHVMARELNLLSESDAERLAAAERTGVLVVTYPASPRLLSCWHRRCEARGIPWILVSIRARHARLTVDLSPASPLKLDDAGSILLGDLLIDEAMAQRHGRYGITIRDGFFLAERIEASRAADVASRAAAILREHLG